jgi:hypothetical protein
VLIKYFKATTDTVDPLRDLDEQLKEFFQKKDDEDLYPVMELSISLSPENIENAIGVVNELVSDLGKLRCPPEKRQKTGGKRRTKKRKVH